MKKGLMSFLLLMMVKILFSQSIPLEIVNVDRTSVDEVGYPGAQKLQGNIHFKQGDSHLFCDSGFFYPGQNRLIAQGQVKLIQGDFRGTCSQLDYSGNSRVALMEGGVQLMEGNQRLKTRKVEYRTDTRVGRFTLKGQIDAPGLKATSDSGFFYRDQSLVFLVGNAQVVEKNLIIFSDSIGYQKEKEEILFFQNTKFEIDGQKGKCQGGFYSKKIGKGKLVNQVEFIDSSGNILNCDTLIWNKKTNTQEIFGRFSLQDSTKSPTIWGGYLKRWGDQDSIFVTQHVRIRFIDQLDTTFLITDTLMGNKTTYVAFPRNHFKSDSVLGISGFLRYYKLDSSLELTQKPVIWNGDFQISSERMIQKRGNHRSKIDCFDSCFVVQWVDCCHSNQIKSDTLRMILKESNSKELMATGRVQSIYFDQNGKRIERETEVTSGKLQINWLGNKITNLAYEDHPQLKVQRPTKKGKELWGYWSQREKYFQELDHWEKISRIY